MMDPPSQCVCVSSLLLSLFSSGHVFCSVYRFSCVVMFYLVRERKGEAEEIQTLVCWTEVGACVIGSFFLFVLFCF